MATEIKAPTPYDFNENDFTIFLGGSIEMGAAEMWQDRLVKDMAQHENVVFLNPRRDDWDSSWVQDPTEGTQFHEQVSWEMDMQEGADVHVYYFAKDTKSPITLLELGRYGDTAATVVCCPKEFWRYGNVKMLCDRYDIMFVETYDELLEVLNSGIESIKNYETAYEELKRVMAEAFPELNNGE